MNARQAPLDGIAYTAAEAAEFLAWTETALKQAAVQRRVPHTRFGREVRFTKQDIADILAASRIPAEAPAAPPASARPRRRTAPEDVAQPPVPLRARPEAASRRRAQTT